jgi:hypothetical protein
MKCEEATEFVSALCDGGMIPQAAAEHIGGCEACRTRLKAYAEMGAELRRVASLELVNEAKEAKEAAARNWEKVVRTTPNWWQKGWETMRIPRFAFALLLIAVVVLGFSLPIVRARAHTEGKVLVLRATIANGRTFQCPLPVRVHQLPLLPCTAIQRVNGGWVLYGFGITANDGDRVELGVHSKYFPGETYTGPDIGASRDKQHQSQSDLEKLPETRYWLEPGQELKIDVEGAGTLKITGEFMDHIPPYVTDMGERLDPNPGEIRLISPVLLRGKEVLQDFGRVSVSSAQKDQGIEIYVPHDGRYELSLSPLESAVEGRIAEGRIKESRISFELDGQPYAILSGAPVAREGSIWILHLPNRNPSEGSDGHAFASAGVDMSPYLAKLPAKN